MANDYNKLSDQLLELLGGKENITFLTHCMTRLRMNVKDQSAVNEDKIKNTQGVLGLQWAGEQLQIIIGQSVGDLYNIMCEKTGLKKEAGVDENLDMPKTKKKITPLSILTAIVDAVSGSVVPLLPLMLGAGLIKVVGVIGTTIGLLGTDSSTYRILAMAGDAGFYFMPIFVASTAAKKFKTNAALAMLLCSVLLLPDFISTVSAGEAMSIFGLPIYNASYANTIFPAVMIVYVMSFVNRFFAKHSPGSIRALIEPLGTMVVMLPLSVCVIAPLGAMISNGLAGVIIWMNNTLGFLGIAILAALYPVMIIAGIHSALGPIAFANLTNAGNEARIFPANYIANFNQGAAALAVGLKTKNKDLKATATTCGITALAAGVTEPTLFGICLRFKKPLYASMVGGFVGAAYLGISNVTMYLLSGSPGLLGIIGFVGENPMNVVHMIIGSVLGMVTTFVLTFIMFKDEKSAEV